MKSFIKIVIFVLLYTGALHASIAYSVDIKELKNTINVLTAGNESRYMGTMGHQRAQVWIENQFKKYGLVKLGNNEQTSYQQSFEIWDHKGTNLIGGLGDFSSGHQCVILGAHYDGKLNDANDCEIPAADDNASGIAGMLEIIRELQSKKDQIKQCVIFAAWDFEEAPPYSLTKGVMNYKTLGTSGSTYFVEHPTIDLNQIQLSITFDLIGGNFFIGAEELFMILGVESSPSLRTLVNKTKSALPYGVRGLNSDIRALEPLHNFFGADRMAPQRSDYDGFRDNNIPFLFISTGIPWYYHTTFDRIEYVNFRKLKSISEYTQAMIEKVIMDSKPSIEFSKKPIQSEEESTETIGVLLRSLVTMAENNYLDEVIEYNGKTLDGPKLFENLQEQLTDLEESISKKEYYKLNKPYSEYHKILGNIVKATQFRLAKERISVLESDACCPE